MAKWSALQPLHPTAGTHIQICAFCPSASPKSPRFPDFILRQALSEDFFYFLRLSQGLFPSLASGLHTDTTSSLRPSEPSHLNARPPCLHPFAWTLGQKWLDYKQGLGAGFTRDGGTASPSPDCFLSFWEWLHFLTWPQSSTCPALHIPKLQLQLLSQIPLLPRCFSLSSSNAIRSLLAQGVHTHSPLCLSYSSPSRPFSFPLKHHFLKGIIPDTSIPFTPVMGQVPFSQTVFLVYVEFLSLWCQTFVLVFIWLLYLFFLNCRLASSSSLSVIISTFPSWQMPSLVPISQSHISQRCQHDLRCVSTSTHTFFSVV